MDGRPSTASDCFREVAGSRNRERERSVWLATAPHPWRRWTAGTSRQALCSRTTGRSRLRARVDGTFERVPHRVESSRLAEGVAAHHAPWNLLDDVSKSARTPWESQGGQRAVPEAAAIVCGRGPCLLGRRLRSTRYPEVSGAIATRRLVVALRRALQDDGQIHVQSARRRPAPSHAEGLTRADGLRPQRFNGEAFTCVNAHALQRSVRHD